MIRPRQVERIVAAARAMLADPNNIDLRLTFVRATFNHDTTAEVIVSLSDGGFLATNGDSGLPNTVFPNSQEQNL